MRINGVIYIVATKVTPKYNLCTADFNLNSHTVSNSNSLVDEG